MHASQEAERQVEEEARLNMAVERLRGVVAEVRVTRDRELLEDEIQIAEDAGLDETYEVYVEAQELLKELLAEEARLGLADDCFIFVSFILLLVVVGVVVCVCVCLVLCSMHPSFPCT